MDEVDRIIVHSLKDIGCNIGNEIESLDQFSTELIVEAAVRCLETIQTGIEIPRTLPQNMAARFNIGASIAQHCKDLGYNGEVGYQTFLYSNVVEVRRVFMFLIEKLPRESEKTVVLSDDPLSKLKLEISREIKNCLLKRGSCQKISSLPFISDSLETGIAVASGGKLRGNPKDWREYFIHQVPFVTQQTSPERTLPSLIALHGQGLVGGGPARSRDVTPSYLSPRGEFPPALKSPVKSVQPTEHTWLHINQSLFFTKEGIQNLNLSSSEKSSEREATIENSLEVNDISEENEEQKKENEKKCLERLKTRIDELQEAVKETVANVDNVREEYNREVSSARDLSKEMQAREKGLGLVTDGDEGLKKLEDSANAISHEILSLASQWERYRAPLVATYMALKNNAAHRQNQSEENFEKVKKLKGKIESVNKQVANKKTVIIQLEEEYEKLPKNINRSAYTHRIMEIIGNIKKQKDQIDKILKDTKELQKEINFLNGRLERSMAVTEETIFRNAKKDDFSKRAFKLLATLHSDCGTIVSMVLEIGTITREVTDLKEQIEVESNKNTGATLERITADLEQMRSESRTLKSQLKSQKPARFSPPL